MRVNKDAPDVACANLTEMFWMQCDAMRSRVIFGAGSIRALAPLALPAMQHGYALAVPAFLPLARARTSIKQQ